MDAKHQFKYTYNETVIKEYSPQEITFEMPGEATLDQILYNFESYLKACGFVIEGTLQIVDDTLDAIDDLDGTLYEFDEEEPKGGCMADFDKKCGCVSISSPLEADEWDRVCRSAEEKAEQKLKEWNEGLSKLEKEVKKNNWVHGICNPPSPDWKATNSTNPHWMAGAQLRETLGL